jgi:hypothetical protein
MESPAVTDRLLIDFWPLHISADGGFAIGAAVLIVVILSLRRRLR